MNLSKYLIIDTAAEICSVSINIGDTVIHSEENHSPNSHASSLTNLIDRCMKMASISYAQLDAICINQGPGSYTGLRIGVSVAKGICFANDIPLIGIDGLLGYGLAYLNSTRTNCDAVLIALDARRDEVYATLLDKNSYPIIETKPIIIDTLFLKQLELYKQIDVISNCPEKMEMLMNVKNIRINRDWKFVSKHLIKISYDKLKEKNNNNLIYFEPNYIKNSYVTKESQITI